MTIPLSSVSRPFEPVPFDAMAPSLDASSESGVRLPGILLRLPAVRDESMPLEALCLTCPHEICHVDYVEDTTHVPLEAAQKPHHPLLLCPCHFSVFDPSSGGDVIGGPADRGLYRFRLKVRRGLVEISGIEEQALAW